MNEVDSITNSAKEFLLNNFLIKFPHPTVWTLKIFSKSTAFGRKNLVAGAAAYLRQLSSPLASLLSFLGAGGQVVGSGIRHSAPVGVRQADSCHSTSADIAAGSNTEGAMGVQVLKMKI
ncbi:hypothetical protein M5K25_011406 [Dendrobium thyrsiflorum]|uniref:Uncharacterized protein n=1 Tax=Dendrobium thyrsiflorum TaxID=117978 RepID=A0ABD0V2N1_DENTH